MQPSFFLGKSLLYVFALLAPLSALAHNSWLEPENEGLTLYQGHRHSAHAGADEESYDPALLQQAYCQNAPVKPLKAGYPLRFADCPRMQLNLSSGYWTKTPWETRNTPKTGVSQVLKSWRSEERLTRLGRWPTQALRPLGQGLEILPLSNPFVLQEGDKLTVQVYLDGKPLAGVPVAYEDHTRGSTDPDGRIAIRLKHGGLQLISTSLETPLEDGKADQLVRSATLQFELPQ